MKKITLVLFALMAFCLQSNAQFTEGFDTEIPMTWTILNEDGGTYTWTHQTQYPHAGAGHVRIHWETAAHDDYLISPQFTVTAGVSDRVNFYAGIDGTLFTETFDVRISTSGTAAADFTTTIASETATTDADGNYTLYSYDLSAYDGQDIHVAIVATDTDRFYLYIDEFSVDTPPTCPEPTSLMASPTSTTEVDITWTAGGTETDWTYEYGVSPYAQGGGGTTGTVMTTPSLSLSGLTAGETYDIYIQANCGVGDDSTYVTVQWTQLNVGDTCTTPIAVTVEADCSVATPYTLNFSNATDLGTSALSCDTVGVNTGAWFEFTTTSTGGITINSTDTGVEYAIFDSCGGTEIGCGDVTGGTLDTALMPSTAYKLAIWKDSATTGTTNICLQEFTPPPAPNCAETPIVPADAATDVAGGDMNLSWTAPSSGPAPTDYEVFFGDTSGALVSLGLVGSTDTNINLTGVAYNTTFYWSVVPYNGITSAVGPCTEWSFTTGNPPPGNDCSDPIVVGALPYNNSDNTANYSDFYSGGPGTGCGTTNNYLNGDDVVYSYTASSDTSINISLTSIGSTYAGVFAYNNCSDIGSQCSVEGDFNGSSTADLGFDLTVVNGDTYYFVVSTWASPQSTAYTLDITENTCTNATVSYTVVNDCDVSGGFNIEVNITDMGSATDITVTDDQGSTAQTTMSATTLTFGPYVNATDVVITVTDDNDANCVQNSGTLTQAACPPANDLCSGSVTLPVDGTVVNGTTESASGAGGATSCDGTIGNDVWYVLTGDGGDITVEVIAANEGAQIGIYESSDGTCSGFTEGTCIASVDDLGALTTNVTFSSVIGTTYYVNLGAWISSGNDFPFTITAISSALSTSDFDFDTSFTYYPNPIENTLTLNAKNTIETITVYNMLGQDVLRAQPNRVDSTVDMSGLANGAYFVKVIIANTTKTIRIIKQ